MAIIHGQVDCLEQLTRVLKRFGINDKKSLEDITEYHILCDQKVREANISALEAHKNEIDQVESRIQAVNEKKQQFVDKHFIARFIESFNLNFDLFVLNYRLNGLKKNTEKIVGKRTRDISGQYFEIKKQLDINKSLIQGAKGELLALEELKKLPDSYHVFNNVKIRFVKPIYHHVSRQYIVSSQIDHVVIGPSGVFNIETKHWSNETIDKIKNFTPFDQARRANFALYCYLNPKKKGFISSLFSPRKLSVNSIVLMTAQNLKRSESRVKVLNLNQLNNYLIHGRNFLTENEVKSLAEKLKKAL